jgi:hypothetical protein
MRPGILVALKTSVHGGVQYQRNTLEEEADGRVAKWETTRYMDDPAEHEAATKLAGKAAQLVSRLCVRTPFGILCPVDREAELDAAVIEMRAMVTGWNSKSVHSIISVNAIKGRIADNDEEAARAILEEAGQLLAQMDRAIADADVEAIKAAAMRTKRLTDMMTTDSTEVLTKAIKAARETAKIIKKRGEDVADRVAKVKIEIEREAFDEARVAFLGIADKVIEALPSIDLGRGAALEVDVDEAPYADDDDPARRKRALAGDDQAQDAEAEAVAS